MSNVIAIRIAKSVVAVALLWLVSVGLEFALTGYSHLSVMFLPIAFLPGLVFFFLLLTIEDRRWLPPMWGPRAKPLMAALTATAGVLLRLVVTGLAYWGIWAVMSLGASFIFEPSPSNDPTEPGVMLTGLFVAGIPVTVIVGIVWAILSTARNIRSVAV